MLRKFESFCTCTNPLFIAVIIFIIIIELTKMLVKFIKTGAMNAHFNYIGCKKKDLPFIVASLNNYEKYIKGGKGDTNQIKRYIARITKLKKRLEIKQKNKNK